MNCPICNNELVEDKERRFETLCDHVSDPNRLDHPLRPTYVCKADECPLHGEYGLLFYDDMGDIYIKNSKEYFEWKERLKSIASQNLLEPINSFSRRMRMEEHYRSQRIKLFRIRNFKWEIHRNFTCNEKGEILRKRFNLQTFKENDRGDGYHWYSGFWHMLRFCIRQFNRNRRYWNKDRNFYEKRDLLAAFAPLEEWQKEDNYRKVFKWYVNTFFKRLKKELK